MTPRLTEVVTRDSVAARGSRQHRGFLRLSRLAASGQEAEWEAVCSPRCYEPRGGPRRSALWAPSSWSTPGWPTFFGACGVSVALRLLGAVRVASHHRHLLPFGGCGRRLRRLPLPAWARADALASRSSARLPLGLDGAGAMDGFAHGYFTLGGRGAAAFGGFYTAENGVCAQALLVCSRTTAADAVPLLCARGNVLRTMARVDLSD